MTHSANDKSHANPRIANIINFIRAVEPRLQMDLIDPVRQQIQLLTRYRLPGTWLLQYDALRDELYVSMLKQLGAEHEIGGWLEIVQPMVEKAGLPWRGRYPWDWHSHVGFSVGYTPSQREKLIDVFMAEFKKTFNRYPSSMGSWHIDAHSLAYMHDRYGLAASCNCKDQWGTDGYTLWGGYWNQAYYPSRSNMLCPAQQADQQIPVPIFRMLGSDPIDQYDARCYDDNATGQIRRSQSVSTLEPVCKHAGGSPPWVRWFFDQMSHPACLAFAYTQVGQENSFGWNAMASGLTDQIQLLAQLQARGQWRVETLEASARWFVKKYPFTPAAAVVALGDSQKRDRGSVWYNSRFYRANCLFDQTGLRIRDIHLFDQRYEEPFLRSACPSPACCFDTLPVVEGMLWSDASTMAGLSPWLDHGNGNLQPLITGLPTVRELATDQLILAWTLQTGQRWEIIFKPESTEFVGPDQSWHLALRTTAGAQCPWHTLEGQTIRCRHNHFEYDIRLDIGRAQLGHHPNPLTLWPVGGRIVVQWKAHR